MTIRMVTGIVHAAVPEACHWHNFTLDAGTGILAVGPLWRAARRAAALSTVMPLGLPALRHLLGLAVLKAHLLLRVLEY